MAFFTSHVFVVKMSDLIGIKERTLACVVDQSIDIRPDVFVSLIPLIKQFPTAIGGLGPKACQRGCGNESCNMYRVRINWSDAGSLVFNPCQLWVESLCQLELRLCDTEMDLPIGEGE